MARFQLHHLADDLTVLNGVDGLKGLIKRIVTDSEAYEDYRFELRMAANIARSGNSKVVRLAGNRSGPDIEFRSANGKNCALACYRVRGEAVQVEDLNRHCFEVMHGGFKQTFSRHSISTDVGLEVIFPSFPPNPSNWSEASHLLVRLWQTADQPEVEGETGIRVRRCVKIASLSHLGIRRRVRIRFMFRVGARERFRCTRHIGQKVLKENEWAVDYAGVPVFAYQVSPWDRVPLQRELADLMHRQDTAFGGFLASAISYPSEGGIAHSFEDLVAHSPGLHLTFCTFGQNSKVWAGDAPAIEFEPEYASSFWDAWEQQGAIVVVHSKPLSIDRKRRRLPEFAVNSFGEVSHEVIQSLSENAIHMRDEINPFEW